MIPLLVRARGQESLDPGIACVLRTFRLSAGSRASLLRMDHADFFTGRGVVSGEERILKLICSLNGGTSFT